METWTALLFLYFIGCCKKLTEGNSCVKLKIKCFWISAYKIDVPDAANLEDLREKLIAQLVYFRDNRRRIYHAALLILRLEEAFELSFWEMVEVFKPIKNSTLFEIIQLTGFSSELAFLPTVLGAAVLRYDRSGHLRIVEDDAPPAYQPYESDEAVPYVRNI